MEVRAKGRPTWRRPCSGKRRPVEGSGSSKHLGSSHILRQHRQEQSPESSDRLMQLSGILLIIRFLVGSQRRTSGIGYVAGDVGEIRHIAYPSQYVSHCLYLNVSLNVSLNVPLTVPLSVPCMFPQTCLSQRNWRFV